MEVDSTSFDELLSVFYQIKHVSSSRDVEKSQSYSTGAPWRGACCQITSAGSAGASKAAGMAYPSPPRLSSSPGASTTIPTQPRPLQLRHRPTLSYARMLVGTNEHNTSIVLLWRNRQYMLLKAKKGADRSVSPVFRIPLP